MQVDGCTDDVAISKKFSQHFSESYSASNIERSHELQRDCRRLRETYCDAPFSTNYLFDVELVSNIIMKLKRGKASDLDNLSAEHVIYSHPLLSVALSKLYNVMLLTAYVPDAFGYSYTVPIPTIEHCNKPKTCSDFRGIAISQILSKIF
jgi:Reverse transcriptase (RNA-dependent DNA polymerase)